MATLGGYLFTLIARRPLGLQGACSGPGLGSGSWSRRTRGGPGDTPGWTAGTGATGHVAAPELPRAGQRELEPLDTWRPWSYPGLGSGSWSHRTRGGPGAAPVYAVHAEVMDTRERVICMPHLLS
jgi:hypothetical protein